MTMLDSPREHPRVLVINGTPIGACTNTGITLTNLFAGWPKERLLQLCYYDLQSGCSKDYSFVAFDPKCAPMDFLVRKLINWVIPKQIFIDDRGSENPAVKKKGLKNSAHDFVRAVLDDSPIIFGRDVIKRVDDFSPQVIYSNLASIRMMKTVLYFSDRYKIKTLVHFMDDWPSTIYSSSLSTSWAKARVSYLLRNILKLSECGMAISELMAKEYERRYGIEFLWAANPIDMQSESYVTPAKKNEVTFMYCGGLHLGRWESLVQIGRELDKFRALGHNVVMRVYVPDKDKQQFESEFGEIQTVQWCGSVAPDEVRSVLSDADILLHVEAFEQNMINYIKYSFSTKISQYMAAGRPILAYAPENVASSRYIDDYGVGILAGDRSQLNDAIAKLLTDHQFREAVGRRGVELAWNEHRMSKQFEKLYYAIKCNAIND